MIFARFSRGTDAQTLAVYDRSAALYAKMIEAEPDPGFGCFIEELPARGHVLDLGCGPGIAARRLLDAGFRVDAVDASQAMVDQARARGVNARRASFDVISSEDFYDGIWANFSLLHAPRKTLPGLLARLKRAIRPDGLFHIGMKLGQGESRDRLGRLYVYYGEDELIALLAAAGFAAEAHEIGVGTGLAGEPFRSVWVRARG